MNFTTGVALVFGAGTGAGLTYVFMEKKLNLALNAALIRPPAQDIDIDHKVFKYGIPRNQAYRVFDDYVSCFDFQSKNAKYVIEHINKDTLTRSKKNISRKNSEFYEDEGIEVHLRNSNESFKASGYDRGHMVPAGSHKGTQLAMNQTFNLSNMSPQIGAGFNRDYWARFEAFINGVAKKNNDLYVVTGPLYLPVKNERGYKLNINLIGKPPNLVHVPTHFYKVVLAIKDKYYNQNDRDSAQGTDVAKNNEGINQQTQKNVNNQFLIGAFVIPNQKINPKVSLTNFIVPIGILETLTGIRFFPKLMQSIDTRLYQVDQEARKFVSKESVISQQLEQQLPQLFVQSKMALQSQLDQAADLSKGTQVDLNHLCSKSTCQLPQQNWWQKPQGHKNSKVLQR